MPQPNFLTGTGVALVTPFHKDGSIDFKSLEALVQFQIKGKTDYLVVLGTTGESVTLSKDEKKAVVGCVVGAADDKIPVVLGVGGNNTHECAQAFNYFDLDGISAILSVSPYYNKPTQKGIVEHYKSVANASPLPLILYNVPGRTGSNMLAETTLKLAEEVENIVAIKEASGNFDQMMKILKHKPKGFKVISGDDMITLPLIASGAVGVISVVANAFPKDFSEMVRQALAGNYDKARQLHFKLTDIIELLFVEGNPGGVKAALKHMKLMNDYVRLPLVPVSKKTADKMAELIENYR
jgi:4-hydroxy-tetrahydrodipicolinate synthase